MSDAVLQDVMLAPVLEQRDDMGRLVAVTWHGAGTDAGGAGRDRWLVAVDGSRGSLRAVEMVAHLSVLEQGPGVDLVHVESWLNKEAAETELARRGWAVTRTARQLLDASSIHWRLYALMGEGAPEIASLADELGSRGIAIGSRGLTAAESVLLGSVAYKVVHLAKTSVLLVR